METRATAFIPLCAPELNLKSGGRKAAFLHELLAAGFPVPPGFVIAPDVDLNQIKNELEPTVLAVGGYPVVVRSSAQLEDLAGASFAGQYVTRSQITRLPELVDAIIACRASAESPQAVSYLENTGFGKIDAQVSVLVQKQVHASVAGVIFSIHPETGHEEHALLECCRGRGERLVSGQTSPTRYVMCLEDGSVIERSAGTEDLYLDKETLGKLRRYTLAIQAHFGVPQDIEWAVDGDGEVWILQSRPITRIRWRHDMEEFTNANFRDGGVSARICTPLMYSLYRGAFQRSMQQYFVATKLLSRNAPQQKWISLFYGRPYWSASAVKSILSKLPGYDEERFDRDIGIQKQYSNAGPARTPTTTLSVLRALPVAIALEKEFRRQLRASEQYGKAFQTQEAHYLHLADSCGAMEDTDFFSLVSGVLSFHTQTHTEYLRTVYNHVNYQTEFTKLIGRIEAATGEAISSLILMSGLLNISHMKLQQGFLQLVRKAINYGLDSREWDEALSEFLFVNHFHGDAELDVSAPRWRECPDRIRQMVQSILQSEITPKDPELSAREQFQLYSKEVGRVRAMLHRAPWQRLRFQRAFCNKLRMARMYAGRREEMREYAMRADDVVRRFLLEAGGRLDRRGWLRREEDVFMLHTDELEAIANDYITKERVLAITEFRRLMYRGYRAVDPPGELGSDVSQQSQAGDPSETTRVMRRGIGCSAGRVTAKARVLNSIAESDSLRAGEVLVTRFTDPAWTPIMGLIVGLVTEVGGVLSHGAVIAREYGVPAVLNVPGATEIVKTGQIVEIDGCKGTVKIIDTTSHLGHTVACTRDPCCHVS